jgi:hypothetical protein
LDVSVARKAEPLAKIAKSTVCLREMHYLQHEGNPKRMQSRTVEKHQRKTAE